MEHLKTSVHGMNGYEYPIISGENYLCVPTNIKMILSSIGQNYNIDDIVSKFTIKTPFDTSTDCDLGVHIKKDDLNVLFTEMKVPLYEEYIPINKIYEPEFTDVLHDLLIQGAHVLCGYSYGELFGEAALLDVGHMSIILSVDYRTVEILNPGPKHAGINLVNEYSLYRAIQRKNAGLWALKSKQW